MARITPSDAQGWGERTKLDLSNLDASLLNQLESEVIGRLNSAYDTALWVDELTTPTLVKTIISKLYVAWFYDRQYSENQDEGNDYAALLRANAEMLMTGLLDGTIDIPGTPQVGSGLGAIYYPNDVSSAMEPTEDDPSLGPAKFSMGKVF
jgi:hypothetical protein